MDWLKEDIKDGYIKGDGTPLKCRKCENTKMFDKTVDRDEANILEFERYCKNCGNLCGYWSYGSWML